MLSISEQREMEQADEMVERYQPLGPPTIAMRRQWGKDCFVVTGHEMARFKRAGGQVQFLDMEEEKDFEEAGDGRAPTPMQTGQWSPAVAITSATDGLGNPFHPQAGIAGVSTKGLTSYPLKTYRVEDKGDTIQTIRKFSTGATRDIDTSKNDYEGFLDPDVLEAYGDYMTLHRKQADGSLRDSDNWQKGMPKEVYVKSLLRHLMVVWRIHRGREPKNELVGGVWTRVTMKDALCAVLFNAMGLIHEILKAERFGQDRLYPEKDAA